MRTKQTFVLFAVGAAAATSLLAGPLPTAAAATACTVPDGDTPVSWTGGATGSSHDWDQPGNWSTDTIPGSSTDYTTDYVCLGSDADVTVAKVHFVAGLDLSSGASLTVRPSGDIEVGAAGNAQPATSYVRSGSTLTLNGGTIGGNGDLTAAGVIDMTGAVVHSHGIPAVQSGTGTTTLLASGRLRIDGGRWGQAEVIGGRTIDNSGTISFAKKGFLEMGDGTSLIDEAASLVDLDGNGGIYRLTPTSGGTSPSIVQSGRLVENGPGKSVIGVPTKFAGGHVKVTKGSLLVNSNTLPTAPLARNTGYGIGTCEVLKNQVCHLVEATPRAPQSAMVTTSTLAPKASLVKVKLAATNPHSISGHALLGKKMTVRAPHRRTTHSTHLTITFDRTVRGVRHGLKPRVYRNGHKITYCSAHGITAVNPSCVFSAKTLSSPSPNKGDLQLFVITIKPKATWAVTK